METLQLLSVFLTGGLFIVAIASVFIVSLNFFSVQFNKRLEKLEAGQAKLEDGQANLNSKLDQLISALREKKVI